MHGLASKHPAVRLCPAEQPELRCDGITELSTRSCGEEGARRADIDNVQLTEAKKKKAAAGDQGWGGGGGGPACLAH